MAAKNGGPYFSILVFGVAGLVLFQFPDSVFRSKK
jgi:hypothetical protein